MSRETDFNLPKNELFYYDTQTGKFKPLAVDGAIPVIVIGGDSGGSGGGSGMRFLSGAGVPTADVGVEGDVYLNTINGDFYRKKPTWILEMNLKGAKGDTGTAGANGTNGTNGTNGNKWILGAVAPTTQGVTNDLYLNTATFDVYSKATGSWVLTGNIKGATGANGINGTNGARGTDGATWLSGNVVPTTEGKVGDFYLHSLGNVADVYKKEASGWVKIADIKGQDGMDFRHSWSGTILSISSASGTSQADLKGDAGFGTEAQYNDIIARLTALENPTP